jgi:hypothetical protein
VRERHNVAPATSEASRATVEPNGPETATQAPSAPAPAMQRELVASL